jgi:hypothetical protein
MLPLSEFTNSGFLALENSLLISCLFLNAEKSRILPFLVISAGFDGVDDLVGSLTATDGVTAKTTTTTAKTTARTLRDQFLIL